MQITESELKHYNLDERLLGAKLQWEAVKKGGYYLCPVCGMVLGKWDGPRVEPPTCKKDKCQVIGEVDGIIGMVPARGILKGRIPTKVVKAHATLKDGTVVATELHRRAGEQKNVPLQISIMLGRLNKAVKLGVSHYTSPSHAERKEKHEI